MVTSEANQALLLVNVESGAIERVFRTNAGVSHMLALSADHTRLYCSNMRDGSVSAFDFKTGEKIKDVKTGKECEGVGVTPDGQWVWSGNRRRHDLDHRHQDARGHQADLFAGLPLSRAVHAQWQVCVSATRAIVVTRRRRRCQSEHSEVDQARIDRRGQSSEFEQVIVFDRE